MWSDWLVFCDCGFQSVYPLMEKDKRLIGSFLMGETDWGVNWVFQLLMGGAMLSKFLIQFSVDGWGCVSSLLFIWGQTMVGASLVAQRVKCLPTMLETWVRSLGQEDPLEKEMAAHSRMLAWKIPWTEKPGRLQSMGSQRVGHDWVNSLHFT